MSTSSQDQTNSQARARAQAAIEGLAVTPTSRVEYRSRGRVAIIGGPEALEIAPRFQSQHQTTVVLLHGAEEPSTVVMPLGGRAIGIEGYLGNFTLYFGEPGNANYETLNTDLVLDLSSEPLLEMPLLPVGYIHSDLEENNLLAAEQQLDELVGTFEKPRYFDYDASICAHARAGQSGCNRCIEACPAEAITSLAEKIEVNPYLCQGGGVCASVCPSGAIRYVYPSASDMLDRIRTILQVYLEHDGKQPAIAFIAEADATTFESIPSNLLPVIVEEVASIGLDTWFSALAYGAQRVLLVNGGSIPQKVLDALETQLLATREILSGLGYADNAVQLVSSEDINQASEGVLPQLRPATHAGFNEKRRVTFMALDHLFNQSPTAQAILSLSAGAPFGTIEVDRQACTLCLSCTSVCPTHAVFAGNDEPKLLFNETQCVQCGICSLACPENAITLKPRLLADPELRQRHVTLHEEEPLCCVSCGKPFATRAMVNNMLAKLEGHWMFQDERARRRLLMCDDCRVADIVQDPKAMEQSFDSTRRH